MTLAVTHPAPARPAVPRLESGDRLERVEFERRYARMPYVKAELVEGTVFMPSPVRIMSHGMPHVALSGWLYKYISLTPGLLLAGDNATVRFDQQNVLQPDLVLLLPAHAGGRARVDEDGYISGPPDLVAEVAASSVSLDLHAKKEVYRRCGVGEYLAWRVEEGAVDWFVLEDGQYVAQQPGDDGLLRSRQFAGLWLDLAALLKADAAAVLKAVDAGAATPEHKAFADRLRQQ